MNLNKQIIITTFLLVGAIIFFGITDIDFEIQNYLYNFKNHHWILNRELEPYKFIFYDGIKKLLIFIALSFLFVFIFFTKTKLKEYRKGILVVILSAIFIPLVVNGLKKATNMPCPKNEIHYGGKMIRTAVWQSYPKPYSKMPRIACWPAGHASGGFALMSLYFLFKRRKNKILALIVGIALGWIMGIYKMMIGDHFFSHNVITMLLAWLIILIIAKIIKIDTKVYNE